MAGEEYLCTVPTGLKTEEHSKYRSLTVPCRANTQEDRNKGGKKERERKKKENQTSGQYRLDLPCFPWIVYGAVQYGSSEHSPTVQRAISDLLKDNKYGSLMTSPGVPLCGTHTLTGGTGVVRQTSTQDTDLWPEVHRSSHCVPEQCGSVATSAGCPARAGLGQAGAAWASAAEGALPGVVAQLSITPEPALSGASQHGVHVVAQVDKQECRWLEEHVLSHLVLVSVFTAASLFNV